MVENDTSWHASLNYQAIGPCKIGGGVEEQSSKGSQKKDGQESKKMKKTTLKKRKDKTPKEVQSESTRRVIKLHYFLQQYQTFKRLLKKYSFVILEHLNILIRME